MSDPLCMNILPDFITESGEDALAINITIALRNVQERKGELRNRVLRFGWDYEKPTKWLGEITGWLMFPALTSPEDFKLYGFREAANMRLFDSVTLNEYVRGQRISPHIDSAAFGDVEILSLLADATMRFTSPAGEIRDFVLPRRSLAVMSGELRQKWTHETLPLDAELRYSIVYRKRLEDDAEIRKLHFDGRTITFSK